MLLGGFPGVLTEAQRWLRYDAAQTHLQHYGRDGDAFLQRIIALDETWASSYEPLPNCQFNEWHHHRSPRKTVVHHTTTNVKVMVIVAYDGYGVIVLHASRNRMLIC